MIAEKISIIQPIASKKIFNIIKNTNFDGMSATAAASALGAVITGIINADHADGATHDNIDHAVATHNGAGVITIVFWAPWAPIILPSAL